MNPKFKWKKNNQILGSFKTLEINISKQNDGLYECEIKTKYGKKSDFYELDTKKLTQKNSDYSLYFTFIDKNITPNGRVEVICQNSKSNYHTYNLKIKSQHIFNRIFLDK